MDLKEILKQVTQHDASDAHFKVGDVPTVRLANGFLFKPDNVAKVAKEDLLALIKEILSEEKYKQWEQFHEIDVSYFLEGTGRFRVNIYTDSTGPAMAFRVISGKIPEIVDLGLPTVVNDFTKLKKGLIIITGPTGHGKSTTLAAILDDINENRPCHIVTIEDPIEYVHQSKKALITQREVGNHTESFVSAIKSALRQDPDVIMVGEMRDRETIEAALTLAETGHLVLSTLHTIDSVQTIDRIIGIFPAEEQPQVRTQLAGTLQGVISQTLVQTKDGKSRLLAAEVLICNNAVRNCIIEAKTQQIYSLVQLGKNEGMQSINDALQILKNEGKI